MTQRPLKARRRTAARVAGATYLLTLATVMGVYYGLIWPLLGDADPTETARNILAHQTLFRLGIAGNVLYVIEVIVLAASLHVVLESVDRLLSLLATLGRLALAFVWLLISLNLFTALRLLTQTDFVRGLPPDQPPVLARLFLTGFDQYYVGLLFWSLGSMLVAWLFLRSRSVPRALSWFGILTSAWAAFCTVSLFVFPDFSKIVGLSWFDVPMVLFEVALGVWLLARGLRAPTDVAVEP
jgi:hypothetical protein